MKHHFHFISITFLILSRITFHSDSDRVDDLMDAMQDEKDIHDQISDAISRGHGDVLDDVSHSLEPLLFELISLYRLILYVGGSRGRTQCTSCSRP